MNLTTLSGGHRLEAGAAAAYLCALASGCPAGITSAYRSPADQAKLRADYLAHPTTKPYAAPVDKSEHVTGQALDLPGPAATWMRAHPGYGFVFTDRSEWWHVAYRISADQHRLDAPTPLNQEDDDMYTDADRARDNNTAASLRNIESILAIEDTGTGYGGIRGDVQRAAAEAAKVRPDINTVANELRALASALGHPAN